MVARILRVDHAGEHGAIHIYAAQIARARKRWPDMLPWLEETLAHERRHARLFADAMPSRGAKPCRLMAVWTIGGKVLGALTALGGRAGVYGCTAAVERTVHRHLVEQNAFLEDEDPALAETVREILVEEDQHLAVAEAALPARSVWLRLLEGFVSLATEVLILISTRGDSLRLSAVLKRREG